MNGSGYDLIKLYLWYLIYSLIFTQHSSVTKYFDFQSFKKVKKIKIKPHILASKTHTQKAAGTTQLVDYNLLTPGYIVFLVWIFE